MEAVAHSPEFAKKTGVPQSVGKDFAAADKGKSFSGSVKTRPDLQKANRKKTNHGSMKLFKEGGVMKPVDKEKNPGLAKLPTDVRNKMGYAKNGGIMKHSDMKQDMPMMSKVAAKAVKGHEKKMHGMAKGGSASSRADGCATQGKTKGTMVSMKKGGSC